MKLIIIMFMFKKNEDAESIRRTGYSVYNEDFKKRLKHNTLDELYPHLPKKNLILFMLTHPEIIMERCSLTEAVGILIV